MRGMSRTLPSRSRSAPSRGRLREQFADERLPAVDLGQVEGGCGEPALEQAGAGGRGRAVDRAEERAFAGAAAGGKDLEVAQGRRVEQERAGAAVFLQAAQVLGLGAEVFGGVVNERAGRAEGGVVVGEAEALQVQHAEGVHDGLRPRGGLEVVGGQFGAEPRRRQRRAGRAPRSARAGRSASERALGDEQLGGIERGEDGQQVLDAGIGREAELARGQIEPGGVEAGVSSASAAR
jgi:hypothetical protein